MPQSFFDSSLQAEDKYALPAAMWEQAINKPPSKKNMERLQANYPLVVIEKYGFGICHQKSLNYFVF